MKLLALDTATEACSVALWFDGAIVGQIELAGREHSICLPRMLDALLAEAGIGLCQLDGLVCGVGPGSFAGVRIGVSYVKGLALGLELPVAPVSSLAMLAQAALRETPDAMVLAAIDARMGEVYCGWYRAVQGFAQPDGMETVCPPRRVPAPGGSFRTSEWVGIGTGWGVHAEALTQAIGASPSRVDPQALPNAADALSLVAANFAEHASDAAVLVPAYLRNNVALTQVEQAAARAAGTLK